MTESRLGCALTALISDLCRNEVERKKITLICILIKKKILKCFNFRGIFAVSLKFFGQKATKPEMGNTIKQIIFAIFSIFRRAKVFYICISY